MSRKEHTPKSREKEGDIYFCHIICCRKLSLNAYFMLDSDINPCKKLLNCVLMLSRFLFYLQTSDIDASS